MNKRNQIFSIGFMILLALLMMGSGCAVNKNPWAKKRSKASHVSTSQLGRNKYYFSSGYQKKLTKSVKKKSY